MESGGRTPEERRAAAEARARARSGEPATGDEDLLEETGPRDEEEGRSRDIATRDVGQRHYGGGDVYLRRRLVALGVVIVLIIAIFLLVGGC
jgi:hypothetical protein